MPRKKPHAATITLSTGYEIPVDFTLINSMHWRGHIAMAVYGERVMKGADTHQDRAAPGYDFDQIQEELRYLIATLSPEIKEKLLYQILLDNTVNFVIKVAQDYAKHLSEDDLRKIKAEFDR